MTLFSADFPFGSRAVSAVFEAARGASHQGPVEKVCFPRDSPGNFHIDRAAIKVLKANIRSIWQMCLSRKPFRSSNS